MLAKIGTTMEEASAEEFSEAGCELLEDSIMEGAERRMWKFREIHISIVYSH